MTQILANNLRTHLERKGWSMAHLSKLAGAGDTAVYDILNQRTQSPKLNTIDKIARALDLTVIDLLTTGDRSAAQWEILSAFSKLSEADQEKLLQAARAWAKEE